MCASRSEKVTSGRASLRDIDLICCTSHEGVTCCSILASGVNPNEQPGSPACAQRARSLTVCPTSRSLEDPRPGSSTATRAWCRLTRGPTGFPGRSTSPSRRDRHARNRARAVGAGYLASRNNADRAGTIRRFNERDQARETRPYMGTPCTVAGWTGWRTATGGVVAATGLITKTELAIVRRLDSTARDPQGKRGGKARLSERPIGLGAQPVEGPQPSRGPRL